jgi:hypothetical protein
MMNMQASFPFTTGVTGTAADISGDSSVTEECDIEKLIAEIKAELGDEQEISIASMCDALKLFKTEMLTEGAEGADVDLSAFLNDHDLAVNIVLMYYSIYNTERKKVVVSLKTGATNPMKPKIRPLIRPKIQDRNPRIRLRAQMPAAVPDRPREFPENQAPVDTRSTDNSVVVDNFNRLLQERKYEGTVASIDPDPDPGSEFELESEPNPNKYMVSYQLMMDKLDELIEMSEFFKDYDRYSQMTYRLRKIQNECRKNLEQKYKTYNHVNAIQESAIKWHKQSQELHKSLEKFNEDTVCDQDIEQYSHELGTFYENGVKELIAGLPIERVTKELEFIRGLVTTYRNLITPLLQSVEIQCPICLESKSNDIYAMPCGHVVCKGCMDQLSGMGIVFGAHIQCPICRSGFSKDKAIKLFLSISESEPTVADPAGPAIVGVLR